MSVLSIMVKTYRQLRALRARCRHTKRVELAFYKEVKTVKENNFPTTETVRDPVTRPFHYCSGGIELVDIWRASLSPEELRGFFRGNVLKYVFRYDKKNGVEDLRKAQVYLGWLIESLEANSADHTH